MENRMTSALMAVFATLAYSWLFGPLDPRNTGLLFLGWYFYLRIGDRFDSLTIAVESLQDAMQRIGDENHTVPSKTSGDQNENDSIAGNWHRAGSPQ